MFTPEYIAANGPQFFTNIIAWVGAATAVVALLATLRKAKVERSALVVVGIDTNAAGAVEVTVLNVGGRYALEVRCEIDGKACRVGHDGMGPSGSILLRLPGPLGPTFGLKLSWIDADGSGQQAEGRYEHAPGHWSRVF